MGDRLQRQPSPCAATAFQPTTNNKTPRLQPTPEWPCCEGPPPEGRPAGKVIAVDGSRGGWAIEGPTGLRAVPERSWRAPLAREALGEPVPDRQPFAWFAWLQRARVTSRWLFGFVGCVGQRPGPLGEAVDFKGRFPPAPACSSCMAQAAPGLWPLPHPVPVPRRECCLRSCLSSPWCRVSLLSFISDFSIG